jgi:hypothetical protein
MITIKYVSGETIAFQLGVDLWYLCMGPGIPCLYDDKLRKQVVPNIDNWLQAKTGHRYSYRTICDMAAAFATGLKCSYSAEDVVRVSAQVCRATVHHIFQTEIVEDYRRLYWIELLDPAKLPQQAHAIRDDFKRLKEKLGDEVLYNHLCRLWRVCTLQNPSEAAVFEKLIERMGRKVSDPKYPTTDEVDQLLCQRVVGTLLHRDIPQYQGVDEDVMRRVDDLQAGRLQRSN